LYNKKLNIFRSGLFRAYAFFETLAFFRCLNFFKELLPLLPCSSTSAFGDCKVNTFFALANLFRSFFPRLYLLFWKRVQIYKLQIIFCKYLRLFFKKSFLRTPIIWMGVQIYTQILILQHFKSFFLEKNHKQLFHSIKKSMLENIIEGS